MVVITENRVPTKIKKISINTSKLENFFSGKESIYYINTQKHVI